VYYGESGALNEGFSDIWGACVENYAKPSPFNNWLLGEDAVMNGIRSLSSPSVKGQPTTYHGNNWYYGSNYSIYVHTNSGILNYWFYLLTMGGIGTNDNGVNFSVSGIGIDKSSKIAYKMLTSYLTSGSDYSDAQGKSILAAKSLYGNNSTEVTQVANAWNAVGLPTISPSSTAFANQTGGTTYTILNIPDDAVVTWHTNRFTNFKTADNHYVTLSNKDIHWVSASIQIGSTSYTIPGKIFTAKNVDSRDKKEYETFKEYLMSFDSKTHTLNIQFVDKQSNYTVQLYDIISGTPMLKEEILNGEIHWDLSSLPKNVYVVYIYNQNTGKRNIEKILK
jgi:hypothetical protein